MQSDLAALEFGAIQRLLEKLTSTPYGADAARDLAPAPTLAIAQRMQASVSAARRLIEAGAAPRLTHVPDIRAALRQAASSGAALPGTALHNIRQIMHLIGGLQPLCARELALYPGPDAHLQPPADLLQTLDAALRPNGHLREDASPRLAELHAEFRRLREEITQALKARMAQADVREVFRNDPDRIVWQGHRGMLAAPAGGGDKIKGVRRGSAANGRDQLIEPMELVALNNRAETLNGQQEAEQHALRRALTDRVREHQAALQALLDALTWIDLAFAAGHLSVHLNAAPPTLIDTPAVALDRAYHPALLLQFADGRGAAPVPLSIELDAEQPMLIITGPNTGGKTVVLKTVGLLVTMAHCGLHIPAEGECRVGAFTRVIVGIGDAQSLHHQLSTFAGHVEILKRLANEADAQSLVLIDELGTGTDPEEGAALAMAVLDELSERGVRGIITTHLSPLKGYAERHARLRNASMHFDRERLAPTYELKLGVSGVSHGLTIAGKNGLPESLVARAREHLRTLAPEHYAHRDE